MDIQATQKELQELLTKLKINGVIDLEPHVEESTLCVVVKDLTPISQVHLLNALKAYPQVKLDHKYTPTICQKAYDALRYQNPSHYVDLDSKFSMITENDTVSYGRKVCELVQEMLTGHSPYSSFFWQPNDLLFLTTPTLTVEQANEFILNNVKTTSLNLYTTHLLSYQPNQTITLSAKACQSAFNDKSDEIYGFFSANFTITAQDEISIEFPEDTDTEIDTNGVKIIISKDGFNVDADSDDLISELDKEAVKLLNPSEEIKPKLIELFKKQFSNWTFKETVSYFNL